jgi:glucose/arabinose dehydrogenase
MGTGLSTPVDICQLDSSSHLVVQKRGLVALVRTGSQAGQSTVLDIQSRVVDSGEGGLLSCAVDPEFPTEPYVYFGYITNGGGSAGQKRVSRFTWDVTRRTFASSSEVILVGDCSQGSSMCMRQDRGFLFSSSAGPTANDVLGGQGRSTRPSLCSTYSLSSVFQITTHSEPPFLLSPRFGPDNALYVATGDQALGGSGSQDTNDQSTGKILRINKADGRGFADNPFCSGGSLGSPRCRVWAYGFRNPWTFDFVPNSNNLLVFHVGEGSMESVILTTSGTNAGWPCYEGRNQRWGGCPGFSASSIVYQYSHTGNSASISGGTYFGRQFPGAYEGAYLIADYVRDTLSSVARGTATSFGGMGRVARIKKGRVDGLVYVLSLSSGITWVFAWTTR